MRRVLNYFKGLAIGVCALIPGVSGGTMALLLGIYERLINAISSFSPKKTFSYFKLKKTSKESRLSKSYLKSLDLPFIFTILAGVITMLFVGATGILQLLETHYAYTISFFIGLIIASGFFIYRQIDNHKMSTVIPHVLLGVFIGLSFLFIVPNNLINPPFWYLIFSGFFSVSALFFPGISGSLILLLLGVYEFMLSILTSPINNWLPILGFAIGLILGAVIVSKFIAHLLKNNKSAMLYFLLGLIFGSIAIPIKKILFAGIPSFALAGLFFVVGFIVVLVLERINA